MPNFNKKDLVAAVSKTTGKAQKDVDEVITATLSVIREQADAGDTVILSGFGRFKAKERAARPGRNPATGEPITIAASRSLGFKPSKSST